MCVSLWKKTAVERVEECGLWKRHQDVKRRSFSGNGRLQWSKGQCKQNTEIRKGNHLLEGSKVESGGRGAVMLVTKSVQRKLYYQ